VTSVVIDTSVVAKWYRAGGAESHTQIADAFLDAHFAGRVRLVAPDLVAYELGNALAKAHHLSLASKSAHLEEFLSYDMDLVPLSADTRLRAMTIGARDGLSYYDACFVALAERLGAELVTADKRLARRATYPRVRTLAELDELT
jgi:predicted nucleic acid-binding protein